MPPPLALLLTVGGIVFLIRRDVREQPNVSSALWLPVIWVVIIGSRPISQWLNLGSPAEASALEDGSPLDRLIYLALIIAGICVLSRRGVRISEVIRENRWLSLFLLYCLLSILWSDFPFVALKRWFKVLGHPIMVLIVLTEVDRTEALSRLMKRSAYILIPISMLFVKYYPDLGRGYDQWTGRAFYTGITTNKNALGYLCMVFGFFFVWQFLRALATDRSAARRNELIICVAFLSMVLWLLLLTDAKTAFVTFSVSALTTILLGTRFVVKKYIGVYVLTVLIAVLSAELLFGVYSETISLLGRDPTLTDRTQVWSDVLAMDTDPVLGTGFESFWLGERLETLWAKYWWQPNQAHNGYIEIYLNLGMVGALLFAGLIVATFRKISRQLLENPDLGKFRFALLLALLLFSYTDALFKALHPLYFIFYLIAMDYPEPSVSAQTEDSESIDGEHNPELITASCPDVHYDMEVKTGWRAVAA